MGIPDHLTCLSHIQLCNLMVYSAVHQASLSITNSLSPPKPMFIELVMLSNHLILSSPSTPTLILYQHQSFFPMSQFFASGGQTIGVSASTSVLPMNTQDWSPLGWTGWISLQFKGFSRVFSSTTVQKHQFFGTQLSLYSKSHIHIWLLEKTIASTTGTYVDKAMSLLFNMLYRLIMEKAMAPHSSTLAWKIPWTEESGGLQSMGLLRVEHNWATSLSLFTFMHWRRKWQPTPVFFHGESQGRGSLVGYRLWGRTESDTTEVT